jgi:hypothetical protein
MRTIIQLLREMFESLSPNNARQLGFLKGVRPITLSAATRLGRRPDPSHGTCHVRRCSNGLQVDPHATHTPQEAEPPLRPTSWGVSCLNHSPPVREGRWMGGLEVMGESLGERSFPVQGNAFMRVSRGDGGRS